MNIGTGQSEQVIVSSATTLEELLDGAPLIIPDEFIRASIYLLRALRVAPGETVLVVNGRVRHDWISYRAQRRHSTGVLGGRSYRTRWYRSRGHTVASHVRAAQARYARRDGIERCSRTLGRTRAVRQCSLLLSLPG